MLRYGYLTHNLFLLRIDFDGNIIYRNHTCVIKINQITQKEIGNIHAIVNEQKSKLTDRLML